ncbi:AAA family ATPase [Melissococcus plutonius]|uniref:Chromosome (Plasmid) partitioning protein ParA n=3 Tax=Melissococcus plutonius TaxID=33970 RepID=A0A2Z5Y509_9ENTE|nr:AAA family ATPase [Melissococcus plutonius]KMT26976.1 cobyrinic acid a,c-diamide synthase [Melissococcus plutonius]KMT29109.1 cobyrinic acid a,c-diamide synthase [Melissococcus plutonius]KMT33559.1 cobyrinic acid a,c-diamide synthase [Melissococcus plutonius]MCV2499627.1 AAA family ATPase [Melissococcus plutonius]MCV2501876.1 AAA family ATPase [Melissococcus plutonius]
MKATVLSLANFKGGVGKTSTIGLVAYNMATKLNKKVLVIDFDAQGNITNLLMKTSLLINPELDNLLIENTLMSAIANSIPLNNIIINITNNLDLIPNAVDFSVYTRYLERNFTNEQDRMNFFLNLIEPLKDNYDYIFIDVPPTLSLLNDTAFMACDQIIVVLQTKERSLADAEVFIEYMINNIKNEYKPKLEVLGILPVLSKKNVAVDTEVLKAAINNWGAQWIFENMIFIMERVKRMDMTGITDNPTDIHDKRCHEKFIMVAKEIINRLERK